MGLGVVGIGQGCVVGSWGRGVVLWDGELHPCTFLSVVPSSGVLPPLLEWFWGLRAGRIETPEVLGHHPPFLIPLALLASGTLHLPGSVPEALVTVGGCLGHVRACS